MSKHVLIRLREHLEADPIGRDVLDRPFELCPACDMQAIEKAESELGFRLPQLLKDIYTTVANGGFGPGYGVMGVSDGFTDDLQHDIVGAYKSYAITIPDEPTWIWPRGWVPFCHWGCIVYSVLDCTQMPNPVYFMGIGDKEAGAPMDSIIIRHKPSLAQWLADWMDGKDLWQEIWG